MFSRYRIIIILAGLYFNLSSAELERKELLQVSVVTRHGQRTPEWLFPKDPYRAPAYWPEGLAELTSDGYEQMKALGEILRKRYTLTIPIKYTITDTWIKSSGLNRTIFSAIAMASGLFPNQSVPVIVTPIMCDYLLNSQNICPAFLEEKEKIAAFPEVQEEDKKYQPLYMWLSPRLGKKITNLEEIYTLYTNLLVEKQRGLHLPEWADGVFPEPLKTLAGAFMARDTLTPRAQRLRIGSLLLDILDRASSSGIGKYRRLNIYSAHDVNLIGLLKALDYFDGTPPGFGSALIFEVHRNGTSLDREISIFYRNESFSDLQRLYIPLCGKTCSLKTLRKLLNSVLPKNISAECMPQNSNSSDVTTVTPDAPSKSDSPGRDFLLALLAILGLTATVFMVLWLIYSAINKCRGRRSEYTLISGNN